MKSHEYANIFPMMSDLEIARLAEDIKQNGLSDPIITLDGKILDGRNRHKACGIAEVEPAFRPYTGTEPLAFVISHNLHRRHLDESQRGMVAAKLANMTEGRQSTQSIDEVKISQPEAAALLNVSVPTVTRAKAVIKNAIPAIVSMVETGELSASAASEIARLPKAEQQKAAAGGVSGAKSAAKKSKQSRTTSRSAKSTSGKPDTKPQDGTSSQGRAMDLWDKAKSILEQIQDSDQLMTLAMTRAMSYCQQRMDRVTK